MPTETPAASATPAPSESPVPSETPVPTETPAPSEEPAIDGQALLDELMAIEDDEAFIKAVNELTEEQAAALEALGEEALAEYALRVETLTAQEETVELNAEDKEFTAAVKDAEGVTVTVKVPAGSLPVNAQLVAEMIEQDTEKYTKAEEALADETLNEQPTEYAGMVAMDIRFEVDGEEIEPLQPVEVTIDAQALLPEDADPETVAVQHLKEDETGAVVAVETVADATEETGDVTVEATQTEEPAMDMASTFAVDGFSTFVITWGENQKVTVYFVAENGSQIKESASEQKLPEGEAFDLSAYGEENDIDGYRFQYALLDNGPAENGTDGEEIDQIRYTVDGKWQYGEEDYYGQVTWVEWNLPEGLKERRVFLVYRIMESDPGVKVDTVDTSDEITINLFDYEENLINNQGTLQFKSQAAMPSGVSKVNPNYWTNGNGGALQGIVQNKLGADGFPMLCQNSAWNFSYYYYGQRWITWNPGQNESLAYLFNENPVDGKSQIVKDANYLFQKDADGYYYYDSDVNRAVLEKDHSGKYTNQFAVYSNDSGYFNPFATAERNGTLNKHFGMTIETTFVMPEEGKVNGQDMVFEFTGDDDVWVFIDDVLVLDIGGIHGAVNGSINFAKENGVTVDQVNTGTLGNSGKKTWSIEALFKTAGKEWDDSDYSTHTLKFFYLERGAGDSNCKIRFNLPVIPKASLVVSKSLAATGNDSLQSYLEDTMTYRFRVMKADGNTSYFTEGTEYQIMKNGQQVGTGTVDVNGVFTLKAGQMAVFPEVFDDNAPAYYVQELLPENANGQYNGIEYTYSGTGGSVTIGKDDVVLDEIKYAGYNTATIQPEAGQTATVSYTNKVDTSKMASLEITKQVEGDGASSADVFQMQVKVNGELLPVDTVYTVNDKKTKVENEGIIKLHAGETATILMLADSTYEVQEVNLDTELYTFVSYQVNNSDPVTSQTDGVSGTIDEPKQVERIIVTNQTVDPDDDTELEKKPNYEKKAVDDDKDGIYDLSLSVSGEASRNESGKEPINVLFVLDVSPSMRYRLQNDDFGQKSRIETANSAIGRLTSQLTGDKGYDAQFALVTFHGSATYKQDWTSNADQITGEIPGRSSGTNYKEAIQKAKTALNEIPQARKDYPTAVIFVSDGEPNQGGSYDTSALQAAKNELKKLTGFEFFYTVGVGPKNNYENLKSMLTVLPGNVGKKHFDGTNEEELNGAFEEIAQEITYTAFSNVTINDELSDYVDVQVDNNNNPAGFQIKVTDDKNQVYTSTGQMKQADGTYTAELKLKSTAMNAFDATLTATYNPTAKTLTLDFPNEYKLENKWQYEVHINIQPNDQAEEAYIAAGYTYPTGNLEGSQLMPNPPAGTADEGTGTHQNQVGFYSNKSATIVYTAQNGKRYQGEYEKPVVQLDTTEVTITKTFEGLDANQIPADFQIEVNDKILNGANKTSSTATEYVWKLNLPDGSYKFTESGYNPEDSTNKVWASVDVSGNLSGGNKTPGNDGNIALGTLTLNGASDTTVSVAVTNHYEDADGVLIIKKKVTKFANNGTPVFDFKVTAEDGTVYYYHVDMTGVAANVEKQVVEVTLPAGDYTVEELENQNYTQTQVVGLNPANKVTIGGADKTVLFTNEGKNTNIPTDGSGVVNNAKQTENGVVIWKDPEELGAEHEDNITGLPTSN